MAAAAPTVGTGPGIAVRFLQPNGREFTEEIVVSEYGMSVLELKQVRCCCC